MSFVLICISLMASEFKIFTFIRHLCFIFWELPVRVFNPFIELFYVFLFSFLSSLYILDTNPLLDVCLTKVLSHSLGHLFARLTASFTVQKLFSFIKSYLSIAHIISGVSRVCSENPRLWPRSPRLWPWSPCLWPQSSYLWSQSVPPASPSSRVSSLIFRSLIQLELILCVCVQAEK